jgi:threonine synthase
MFRAVRVDDEATLAEIARMHRDNGLLIDPHTATATAAAHELGPATPGAPVVSLATAHPAKFPDAVRAATGIVPALPDHLADLFDRVERVNVVANDLATVERAVEQMVAS